MNEKIMRVLGIETSCDETAVAIVDSDDNIICNIVLSQIDEHRKFGGVVPEVAARNHLGALEGLIERALDESDLTFDDIDAIAATGGPGLIGGVMVGVMMAKSIASVLKKPFIAVNHLEGHALTARLTDKVEFPYMLLLISGGHCQILVAYGLGSYKKLGTTIDDALGEAFDKVAQMVGLPYPGGPQIEMRAKLGDENRFNFPQPLVFGGARKKNAEHKFNFSFSGLKTAVRRTVEELTNQEYNFHKTPAMLNKQDVSDICASFQKTVSKILISRITNSINFLNDDGLHNNSKDDGKTPKTPEKKLKINKLVVAGGVGANQYIKQKLSRAVAEYGYELVSPPIALCTDNAAMIAYVGMEKLKKGMSTGLNFIPKSRLPLDCDD